MGDVECIADRFADFCPDEGELELSLSFEVKDSVSDREGNELKNECVEWHYYYIGAEVKGEFMQAEIGSTLYNMSDNPLPRYHEGDTPVVRGLMRFLSRLQEKDVRARIAKDDSGLFDETGTLQGCYLKDALVRAGSRLSSLNLEKEMSGPVMAVARYCN